MHVFEENGASSQLNFDVYWIAWRVMKCVKHMWLKSGYYIICIELTQSILHYIDEIKYQMYFQCNYHETDLIIKKIRLKDLKIY